MQPLKIDLTEAQEISLLLIEDAPGDAMAIIKALLYGETEYSFKIQRKASLEDGLDFLAATMWTPYCSISACRMPFR